MSNPRKLITAAVATYLSTPIPADDGETSFLTDAKGRVYDTDATPPDADMQPEINVLFLRERIDDTTQHDNGLRRRVMSMNVECYHTKGKSAADDLSWQVEEAMRANSTIGNMVEWCMLSELNLFVVENQTVSLFCIVMTFDVVYWTHEVEVGGRPRIIMLGFDPDTGPGNEPEYHEVADI